MSVFCSFLFEFRGENTVHNLIWPLFTDSLCIYLFIYVSVNHFSRFWDCTWSPMDTSVACLLCLIGLTISVVHIWSLTRFVMNLTVVRNGTWSVTWSPSHTFKAFLLMDKIFLTFLHTKCVLQIYHIMNSKFAHKYS